MAGRSRRFPTNHSRTFRWRRLDCVDDRFEMSYLKTILVVHAVLAIAPFGIRFVPPHVSALPVIWALASITLSQLMLLAIYLGMFADRTRNRLGFVAVGIVYLGACQVISQQAMDASTPIVSIAGAYLGYVGMDAGILFVITGVLACTRRVTGSVRRMREIPPNPVNTRPQYSLLALLLVLSLAALVMGLVRSSRMADEPSNAAAMVVQYVLFATVFSTNIVATVWATLGIGSVPRKLTAVVAVSVILGLSLGVGARHDAIGWWLLAWSSLMTLIPTAIIASTLLSLRPLGFRLTRLAADGSATEQDDEPECPIGAETDS